MPGCHSPVVIPNPRWGWNKKAEEVFGCPSESALRTSILSIWLPNGVKKHPCLEGGCGPVMVIWLAWVLLHSFHNRSLSNLEMLGLSVHRCFQETLLWIPGEGQSIGPGWSSGTTLKTSWVMMRPFPFTGFWWRKNPYFPTRLPMVGHYKYQGGAPCC